MTRQLRLMSRTPDARSIGVAAGAALITGVALGNLGNNLMPVLLPGMADRFALSHTVSGLVATVQLLATAVASLALASRATRPGRARIARLGLIAAVTGFGLAFVAPNLPLLLLGNVVAGAGLGVVCAVAMAAIAATADTDRATAVAVLGATIVLALLIIVVPQVNDAWDGSAGFAILAICCVPAFWIVGALPDAAEHGHDPASYTPMPLLLLPALALLAATDQGAWSYSEILGEEQAGMSADAVSTVLSVAALTSLVGIGLGSVATRQLRRLSAIAVFITVELFAKLFLAAAPSPIGFTIAAIVWQMSYMGLLVLLLAVAAAADPSGRWVAASSGAVAVGTGLGPASVGWVLDASGPVGLGVALAVATAVAAVPLLRTTRAVEAGLSTPLDQLRKA